MSRVGHKWMNGRKKESPATNSLAMSKKATGLFFLPFLLPFVSVQSVNTRLRYDWIISVRAYRIYVSSILYVDCLLYQDTIAYTLDTIAFSIVSKVYISASLLLISHTENNYFLTTFGNPHPPSVTLLCDSRCYDQDQNRIPSVQSQTTHSLNTNRSQKARITEKRCQG